MSKDKKEKKMKNKNIKRYRDVLRDILTVWKPSKEDLEVPLQERKVLYLNHPGITPDPDGGQGEFYLIPFPANDYLLPDLKASDFVEDQLGLVKLFQETKPSEEDLKEMKERMDTMVNENLYFCLRVRGREIQTWMGKPDLAVTIYDNFEQDFYKKLNFGPFDGPVKDIEYSKSLAMWIPREELIRRLFVAKSKPFPHFNYLTHLNV